LAAGFLLFFFALLGALWELPASADAELLRGTALKETGGVTAMATQRAAATERRRKEGWMADETVDMPSLYAAFHPAGRR
jgi:hypothetical protein